MKRLQELEGNQEQVKQELEKNIQNLKTMISKYDADYSKNMEVLNSIADPLMSLLKNVSACFCIYAHAVTFLAEI